MGYVVILLAILLAAVIGWMALRAKPATPPGGTGGPTITSTTTTTTTTAPPRPTPPTPPIGESKLSRAALQDRLRELARSEAPKDLAPGAMCYAPTVPKTYDKVEYVCPTCGEKTLYAVRDTVRFLEDLLPACRRRIQQVTQLPVRLDEKEFCRKCSPEVKAPALYLLLQFAGEADPRRVKDIGPDDLVLLAEFLAGKKKHGDAGGAETTPLKNYVQRLEAILGVKAQ